MATPYVGEIRMFAGTFAPAGWLFCDGGVITISENETLFQLIGTTYGGDGQSTFALPDLRGRVPIHQGQGPGLSSHTLAETGGVEEVTLTTQQIPPHTHVPVANTAGVSDSPGGNVWATANGGIKPYGTGPGDVVMNGAALAYAGGNQPHDNHAPYLCVHFIISLYGIFPTPT